MNHRVTLHYNARILLFIWYIADLPDYMSPGVQVSFFADDLAIWVTLHESGQIAENRIQVLDKLTEWAKEKKMTINASKCETCLMSIC